MSAIHRTAEVIANDAEVIADDALEAVRYGKEHARWIGALMTSICLDMEHNKGRRVADLAALGQYLGDDCANYLDCEAERLQRELAIWNERRQATRHED